MTSSDAILLDMMGQGYEIIEHTADAGLRVWGASMAELMSNAALGMYRLMAGDSKIEINTKRMIRIASTDPEALLVDWLSELVFYTSTYNELFSEFIVRELSDTGMKASVGGEQYDPQRHDWHTEIKAVTYHGLYIRESKGLIEARIFFDV